MDLHLIRNNGEYESEDDCYYGNCVPDAGFSTLDWGTPNDSIDDPNLDLDDIENVGPENINIAEPDARAGFAGPNIIEQTIRQKLPKGFQRSEFLLEHGAIDMIVHRNDMRETLARVLAKLTNLSAPGQPPPAAVPLRPYACAPVPLNASLSPPPPVALHGLPPTSQAEQ